MADSAFDPSAAAARQRRMDLRRKKATTPSGLIVCRKHLGVGLLPQKRDTSDDSSTNSSLSSFPLSPSSISPPHSNPNSSDPITAAAYTALRTKFRRSQFRRPRKGKGNSASAEGSSGSKSPRGVNGQEGDGGGGGDGGEDEDSSSDLSSETSSSGTTSSGEGNDAEVDAALSVAASLLQEETKLQSLGMDGVTGAGGAAADATAFVPLPPRVIPPSTCSGAKIKGAPADECPGNGVLSVCGRRREMEDAVSMVPAFALVPCASRAGCSLAGSDSCGGQGADDPQCQLHMFAVFDGHGGSQAANFLSAHMATALAEELSITLSGIEPLPPVTPDAAAAPAAATGAQQAGAEVGAEGAQKVDPVLHAHWQRAMVQSFARMDAEISGHCFLRRSHCHGASGNAGDGGTGADGGGGGGGMTPECVHEPLAAETVGSTSVVLVVTAHHLVVGNCGDSRAVLCRGGKAVPLSKDHKPEREDEMKRVEKAGGRVIFWNGYRVLGVLAMSRAIGDRYLKPYVIPEPEVTITERHPDDELVVLASDGLWDVISNEAAVDIARRCLAQRGGSGGTGSAGAAPEAPPAGDETAAAAAETLAAAGAQGEEEMTPAALAAAVLTKLALVRGSGDNISVVVVDLRGTR